MRKLLFNYATPLTTGLFIISLISGVALFFHLGSQYFHGMHEWLSMVLILPFLLHIWKNWRPFLNYFRRIPMALALTASIAAAAVFVAPSLLGTQAAGGNPAFALLDSVTQAPIQTVAPVLGHTPQSMAAALQEKGYTVASLDNSVADVLKAAGAGEREAIALLASIRK